MRRLAEFVLRMRAAFLVVLIGAVGWSAHALPDTEFSLSIVPLIRGTAAERARRTDLATELPIEDVGYYCVLTFPRPLDADDLALLGDLGERLTADPRIDRVRSLATVPVMQRGWAVPRPFPDALGERGVLEVAAEHPLLLRRLISADGRSCCLLVSGRALAFVRDTIRARVGPEVEMRILGGNVAEVARREYMKQDLALIVGLELLIFTLILPFVFRTLRGVVLPIGAVVIALALNFGLLAAFGGSVGIIELALPGLIIMIGLSDAVHMLHRYEEARAEGRGVREAILEMSSRVGVACLVTSLTTATGFLSLVLAEHPAIVEFGLKGAVAVLVTFVATFVLMPLGLSLFPAGAAALPRVPGLGTLSYGRPRLVWSIVALALVLAGIGMSKLEVNARWLEELPPGDPIKQELAFLEDQFAGVLVLEADVRGDLLDPAVFRAVERFQERMLACDGVIETESVTQWLREARGNPAVMRDDDIATGGALLRLLLEAEPQRFPHHVVRVPDFGRGRVILRVQNLDSRRYLALRDELDRIGAEEARVSRRPLSIGATGLGLLAHESGSLVTWTLIESLVRSLAAITLLIMVLYRSIRIGLIAILPNLLPVFVALGINGFLDMPLRLGVVMIYSLGLGLAVDDTIHILTRLVQERRQHPAASLRRCLLASLRSSGSALLVTSIILALGALCFLPANFQSIHDVGILMSVIVAVALLADLFVLPLLVERFGGRGG